MPLLHMLPLWMAFHAKSRGFLPHVLHFLMTAVAIKLADTKFSLLKVMQYLVYSIVYTPAF